MTLLETTQKYRVNTEDEAKSLIESFKDEARQKGYLIKKASYEYKNKKAKGEIIAECYLVSVTQIFDELWGDL